MLRPRPAFRPIDDDHLDQVAANAPAQPRSREAGEVAIPGAGMRSAVRPHVSPAPTAAASRSWAPTPRLPSYVVDPVPATPAEIVPAVELADELADEFTGRPPAIPHVAAFPPQGTPTLRPVATAPPAARPSAPIALDTGETSERSNAGGLLDRVILAGRKAGLLVPARPPARPPERRQ